MCVLHKFCIFCFCVCLMTHALKSDDADHESKHDNNLVDRINSTGSRDQNVKDVNHARIIDKLKDIYPNNSFLEGIHYVEMIFEKFGNTSYISIENFEKLFHELEYRHSLHEDHDHEGESSQHEHNKHSHPNHTVDDHDHDHDDLGHDHDEHSIDDHSKHDEETECTNKTGHVHNEMKTLNKTENKTGEQKFEKNRHKRVVEFHHDHSDCLNAKDILELFNLKNRNLNFEQFLHTCPALLYQQINPKCKKLISETEVSESLLRSIPSQVWGYSTLAVVIISLVGLLGVAVIPIMQKVFYNHLLQFLVALAVGALTGDALLHLLPHALVGEDLHSGHDHGNHGNHQGAVLKGLCGLSGLFFFFVMERTLTIVTKIKRKRKQSKRNTLSPKDITACKDDGNHIAKKLSAYDESDYQSCEEMVMVVHPNKSIKGYADETHDKIFHTSHDGCRPKEPKHSHANPQTSEEEGMLSLPHSHSGHSHHAHCEMLSTSVASVAWMVILGDGIHNFSDGLAIGAAFSNSITGGVSTSIAVFCHELPHEIGDFAVLLRAGMSIKQAIVYNILSSIMCFMGMLIGVAIGNIDEASSWIFAAVAGMFIYIATVDMLPEMTSVETKRGEHPFCHLFLQCMGMISGAGIMLLIAFFEEDLLTALDG